jgi:hypothetical protein
VVPVAIVAALDARAGQSHELVTDDHVPVLAGDPEGRLPDEGARTARQGTQAPHHAARAFVLIDARSGGLVMGGETSQASAIPTRTRPGAPGAPGPAPMPA